MTSFAEGIEPGSLPFQSKYDDVAGSLNFIQTMAHNGLYGDFHSGVVSQIVRPDRHFLPGDQFFGQISDVLAGQQEPTEEALFDLGTEVGASIHEQYQTPRGLILGYLNTELQIFLLQVGFAGLSQHGGEVAQGIGDIARRVVTEALPLDTKTDSIIKVLGESLLAAGNTDPQHQSVFALLHSRLHDLYFTYRLSKDIYMRVADHYGTGEELAEEERLVTDKGVGLLTQTAMQQRKYGTKPAYIESSMGGAWVFYDGSEYLDVLRASCSNATVAKIPPVAAIAIHVHERDLSAVDLALNKLPIDGSTGRIKRTGEGLTAANPEFALIIQLNGSITLDTQGIQPIQVLMASNPSAGRRLLAEVAANFYDLSVPINVEASSAPRNYTQMTAGEREHFDPIAQLLIPRLRYLQAPHEVRSERTRTVREHGVTWHVRPIPIGWQAAPDAAAKAASVGVVLGPHETFVKAHTRGHGHRILGYHAVHRTTDLIPGDDY